MNIIADLDTVVVAIYNYEEDVLIFQENHVVLWQGTSFLTSSIGHIISCTKMDMHTLNSIFGMSLRAEW